MRWIKRDLAIFIITCPAYVFLKTLTESLLNFRSLSFEVNLMCCVKEKYSNLILIFFILISLALPSQCLLPVYILGIRGGTFPFLHTFISIVCLLSFRQCHSAFCEVIPSWGFNLYLYIFSDIDLFSGDLLSRVSPAHLSRLASGNSALF